MRPKDLTIQILIKFASYNPFPGEAITESPNERENKPGDSEIKF